MNLEQRKKLINERGYDGSNKRMKSQGAIKKRNQGTGDEYEAEEEHKEHQEQKQANKRKVSQEQKERRTKGQQQKSRSNNSWSKSGTELGRTQRASETCRYGCEESNEKKTSQQTVKKRNQGIQEDKLEQHMNMKQRKNPENPRSIRRKHGNGISQREVKKEGTRDVSR